MHAVHCKLEDNNGFLADSCPNVRYIPKFHANDIQLDIWQDVRKMFIFNLCGANSVITSSIY